MKKRIFTDEEKQQIMADYNNPQVKSADIRTKYRLSSKQMSDIVIEAGGAFRCPNAHHPYRSKSEGAKTCPKCRKRVDIKGAKFCPFCAADIRDEKDLALENARNLYGVIQFLPEGVRDKAEANIADVIDYIRKGK